MEHDTVILINQFDHFIERAQRSDLSRSPHAVWINRPTHVPQGSLAKRWLAAFGVYGTLGTSRS